MRRFWLAAGLALLAQPDGARTPVLDGVEMSAHGQAGDPARPAPEVRLLVILVVDQLRAGDLDLHTRRWSGGFRVLLDEGAHFTRAEYPYLHTATCAGHATIGTGTLPKTHGIVLNHWWDRAVARIVACTEDETMPHVSEGGAAAAGSSAARILVPTLGDELQAQQPRARVVSLSLKARSAIPLAGRPPGVVTWFDDSARSFVTSRAYSSEPAGSIRRFLARDSPDAVLGRPWTLQQPEAAYRYPDLRTGERPKAGWSALFPHALDGIDGADAQFFERWQKSPFSDAHLARMAAAVVDDLQLGRGEATDYLAVSFSALDLLGHEFGPESREAEDTLMRLDGSIGGLLRHLDAALGRENYVVALTSDHGSAPVPEQAAGGRIASEDVQHLLEQTLVGRWGPAGRAPYIAWVGPGSIYFTDGVFDRLRRDAPAFGAVVDALAAVPGVMRVLPGDGLSGSSTDRYVRAAAAGYVPGRSGDLLLVPRRHWIFELRSENDATNHGTPHDYDRRVPVLLRGHRIRMGRYSGSASPADIAPTLAHLAGVRMSKAEGRPLREAVR